MEMNNVMLIIQQRGSLVYIPRLRGAYVLYPSGMWRCSAAGMDGILPDSGVLVNIGRLMIEP